MTDDEETAFVAFFGNNNRNFSTTAHRLVAGMGLPSSAATDVLDEMVTRAWAVWPTILPEHRIGWAKKTMANVAHEHARKDRPWLRDDVTARDETFFEQIECGDEVPSDVVVGRLTADRIQDVVAEVLRTVPPEQRELFGLAWAGWSVQEIARHLDLKPGTVTSQRSRLTQKIERRLRAEALLDARPTARKGGSR